MGKYNSVPLPYYLSVLYLIFLNTQNLMSHLSILAGQGGQKKPSYILLQKILVKGRVGGLIHVTHTASKTWLVMLYITCQLVTFFSHVCFMIICGKVMCIGLIL